MILQSPSNTPTATLSASFLVFIQKTDHDSTTSSELGTTICQEER